VIYYVEMGWIWETTALRDSSIPQWAQRNGPSANEMSGLN
jgi:hypothetical protein